MRGRPSLHSRAAHPSAAATLRVWGRTRTELAAPAWTPHADEMNALRRLSPDTATAGVAALRCGCLRLLDATLSACPGRTLCRAPTRSTNFSHLGRHATPTLHPPQRARGSREPSGPVPAYCGAAPGFMEGPDGLVRSQISYADAPLATVMVAGPTDAKWSWCSPERTAAFGPAEDSAVAEVVARVLMPRESYEQADRPPPEGVRRWEGGRVLGAVPELRGPPEGPPWLKECVTARLGPITYQVREPCTSAVGGPFVRRRPHPPG